MLPVPSARGELPATSIPGHAVGGLRLREHIRFAYVRAALRMTSYKDFHARYGRITPTHGNQFTGRDRAPQGERNPTAGASFRLLVLVSVAIPTGRRSHGDGGAARCVSPPADRANLRPRAEPRIAKPFYRAVQFSRDRADAFPATVGALAFSQPLDGGGICAGRGHGGKRDLRLCWDVSRQLRRLRHGDRSAGRSLQHYPAPLERVFLEAHNRHTDLDDRQP